MADKPYWRFNHPGGFTVIVTYDRINVANQSQPGEPDRVVRYIVTAPGSGGYIGDTFRFYDYVNGQRVALGRPTVLNVGGQGQVAYEFYAARQQTITWEYWASVLDEPLFSLEGSYDVAPEHPVFVNFEAEPDPDNPDTGTGGGGSVLVPTSYTNTGQVGELAAAQSGMRQWFVRAGTAGDLRAAQSSYRQHFVRGGGVLDITTLNPSTSSSTGGVE